MNAHYIEMFRDDEPDDPAAPWGWECWTCEGGFDGYASLREAEEAGEHHRIEEATQQLIDDGDLP